MSRKHDFDLRISLICLPTVAPCYITPRETSSLPGITGDKSHNSKYYDMMADNLKKFQCLIPSLRCNCSIKCGCIVCKISLWCSVVCKMSLWWMGKLLQSINIWGTATKVVLFCPEYQAPSSKPSFNLPAFFSTKAYYEHVIHSCSRLYFLQCSPIQELPTRSKKLT